MLLPWSSPTSSDAAGWSERTHDEPVDAAVLDRILRTRCTRRAPASARAGPSWCSSSPADVDAVLAQHRRRGPDEPDSWLRGMTTAPVVIVPLPQGRLPRPLRRARQGLDRPGRGRWPVPYWHLDTGDGVAADAADRRGRGARRVLLRHPAARDPRLPHGVRRARRSTPRSAPSPSATVSTTPAPRARPPGGRGRRPRSCTAGPGGRPAPEMNGVLAQSTFAPLCAPKAVSPVPRRRLMSKLP